MLSFLQRRRKNSQSRQLAGSSKKASPPPAKTERALDVDDTCCSTTRLEEEDIIREQHDFCMVFGPNLYTSSSSAMCSQAKKTIDTSDALRGKGLILLCIGAPHLATCQRFRRTLQDFEAAMNRSRPPPAAAASLPPTAQVLYVSLDTDRPTLEGIVRPQLPPTWFMTTPSGTEELRSLLFPHALESAPATPVTLSFGTASSSGQANVSSHRTLSNPVLLVLDNATGLVLTTRGVEDVRNVAEYRLETAKYRKKVDAVVADWQLLPGLSLERTRLGRHTNSRRHSANGTSSSRLRRRELRRRSSCSTATAKSVADRPPDVRLYTQDSYRVLPKTTSRTAPQWRQMAGMDTASSSEEE